MKIDKDPSQMTNGSLREVCRGRSEVDESLRSTPKSTRISDQMIVVRVDKLVEASQQTVSTMSRIYLDRCQWSLRLKQFLTLYRELKLIFYPQ
jgi:hypothetical protein